MFLNPCHLEIEIARLFLDPHQFSYVVLPSCAYIVLSSGAYLYVRGTFSKKESPSKYFGDWNEEQRKPFTSDLCQADRNTLHMFSLSDAGSIPGYACGSRTEHRAARLPA